MTLKNTQTLPPSPNFIVALKSGFDATTNHISLILFPIALDLLLWLGPHLRLTRLIQSVISPLLSASISQEPALADTFRTWQEIWTMMAERFNLLVALRSYPVGVPSLMASRLPNQMPFGSPAMLEIGSLGSVLLVWVATSLIGMVIGTLFFSIVSQAAISGEVHWRQSLASWPQASLQVFWLALFWIGLMLVVGILLSCVAPFAVFGGFSVLQCVVLLFGSFMLWLIFPFLFSAHGIFVNQFRVMESLKASVRLTRMTMPPTGLFFLAVIVLSKGLDILWQVPEEASWLTLVGVAGHAFVTTGLLAASFIYYRDADVWTKKLLEQAQIAKA